MKASEIISMNREALADEMVERYRCVLESDGDCQYKIYIWDDGEITVLLGAQGDNSWLVPRSGEHRELYYVETVSAPCLSLWDYTDHSAPEDPDEYNREREDIINYEVGEYARERVYDILDQVISDYERDER